MIDLNGKLGLHKNFRHALVEIGAERAPVAVVDDFLDDPDILVDCAHQSAFRPGIASYPGLRAPISPIYSFALRKFLGPILRDGFGLNGDEVTGGTCGFAIVTTPPQALEPVQRMPHFDSTNPKQIAFLHYLCPASKGGTAFYRHRRTGYERIDPTRVAHYTEGVRAEIAAQGPPPARYMDGSDARYECIAPFEAAYNRVLIYGSISLHSASIAPDFDFDPDPRTGRLTANAIFTFR